MIDPVRLALVGCGRIAQIAHLPALEKAEGSELVAVSDPSEDVAERRPPLRPLGRLHRPGRSGPTSRSRRCVAAPDRFHHALTTEALQAGKHVLVEKPLTSTVAEAEALVELVDRTGLALQVGAMKRHDQGAGVRTAVPRRSPRCGALVQRLVPHR